jgi:hypothetical protein
VSDPVAIGGPSAAFAPPDGLSWFVRDVDGRYSHKRLLALSLAAAWLVLAGFDTAGIAVKPALFSGLELLIAGFGGLSVAERWQPKGGS